MDSTSLLAIRPILALPTENLHPLQVFQNTALRPIMKMLQSKIYYYATIEISKLKNIRQLDERRSYVTQFFNKNPQKTRFLQGMVCGFFTEEEYSYYVSYEADINKRIKHLLIERIATAGPVEDSRPQYL